MIRVRKGTLPDKRDDVLSLAGISRSVPYRIPRLCDLVAARRCVAALLVSDNIQYDGCRYVHAMLTHHGPTV